MERRQAVTVRRARKSDLEALGQLGATLARAHHEWDPRRFFVHEPADQGYAFWLGRELRNRRAVVLAAELEGRVVGYAYGRLEDRDWSSLRDACGVCIDLMVDPATRKKGVGTKLCVALLDTLRAKGAPRVVLQTASRNQRAFRFFRSFGFRPTMMEMTIELVAPRRRRARRRSTG